MAPIRPYGIVFLYSGGAQKSIQGNYQFFEMDQNILGGVMNQLNKVKNRRAHILCHLRKNDSRPKANCAKEVKS